MLKRPEFILERLEALGRYTAQLERYRGMDCSEIASDLGRTRAVEHGLQLCIQCMMDISDRLVAELSLGTPATHPDVIDLLCQAGVLPESLRPTLTGMIRFRDILVHAHVQVDVQRVCSNLQTGLQDLSEFARCVVEFLNRNGAGTQPPSG